MSQEKVLNEIRTLHGVTNEAMVPVNRSEPGPKRKEQKPEGMAPWPTDLGAATFDLAKSTLGAMPISSGSITYLNLFQSFFDAIKQVESDITAEDVKLSKEAFYDLRDFRVKRIIDNAVFHMAHVFSPEVVNAAQRLANKA